MKEYTIEPMATAAGSLKDDINGDCLGSIVLGNYQAATVLNSSNTMSVQVQVATAGSYLIYSNTINGYSFKAEGSFANTGLQMVQLKAFGTPVATGVNDFTITYDTTSCQVSVAVL